MWSSCRHLVACLALGAAFVSCGLEDRCDEAYDPNCTAARQVDNRDAGEQASRPLRYVRVHRVDGAEDVEVRVDGIALLRNDELFFASIVEATNVPAADRLLGAPEGLPDGGAPEDLDCSDPGHSVVIDADGVVVSFPRLMPLWSADEIVVYACGAGQWSLSVGDRAEGPLRPIGSATAGVGGFPVGP